MATNNSVNSPLTGTTGTGNFVGSNNATIVNPTIDTPTFSGSVTYDGTIAFNTSGSASTTIGNIFSTTNIAGTVNISVNGANNINIGTGTNSGNITIGGGASNQTILNSIQTKISSSLISFDIFTGIPTFHNTSPLTVSTVTQHGVVVGASSNGLSTISVGSTGSVLTGVTGSDPIFSGTPSVTSISFDSGTNNLANYIAQSTFTPTLTGATTGGSTTYTAQVGYYSRIGNTVFFHLIVAYSAATGTGNMVLGGFPLTIKNQSTYQPIWVTRMDGVTLPASSVELVCEGIANSTTANFVANTAAGSAANVQMINASVSISVSGFYNV